MAGTVSCTVCMRRSASVRTSSAQGGRGLPCRMFFSPEKTIFIKAKIGSESAKNAVIYKGLVLSRAKNYVNTSVSAFKSCQNTAIYSVSCLPRFIEIAKTV